MPELIYLACPYTGSTEVENYRYESVTAVAAALVVRTGCEVFSPVTHSHMINRLAVSMAFNDYKRWSPTYDFWLRFDYHILDIADWLYILMLDGWAESIGIKMEKDRFLKRQPMKRIKYIQPKDYIC